MKTRLFGEQAFAGPLESTVSLLLAQRNHVLSVWDADDDRRNVHLYIDPPERVLHVEPSEEPAFEGMEGGLLIPLDFTSHKYLFPETMPHGLFLPDLLYARPEDGKVIVQPLDVKCWEKKLRSMRISAPQVAAWNLQNLANKSNHVNDLLLAASEHFGGNEVKLTDGAIVGSFPENAYGTFSKYLLRSGTIDEDEVLEIGRHAVRKRPRRAGEKGACRISEGLETAGDFLTFERYDRIDFKRWRAQMENRLQEGVLYPVEFQVIRRLEPNGEALTSHHYKPEQGILAYTDLRLEDLEERIESLRRIDGTVEYAVERLRIHLDREITLAKKRVQYLEKNLLRVQRRLINEEETTEKRLTRLDSRYAGVLARLDLAQAALPGAFRLNQAFIDDAVAQEADLARGGHETGLLLKEDARRALATILTGNGKGKHSPKGVPLDIFSAGLQGFEEAKAKAKEEARRAAQWNLTTTLLAKYLGKEAGLTREEIVSEIRCHTGWEGALPKQTAKILAMIPAEGLVNRMLKSFMRVYNNDLRSQYGERDARLAAYRAKQDGFRYELYLMRNHSDVEAARTAYRLRFSRAFSFSEAVFDATGFGATKAQEVRAFAKGVIAAMDTYRQALEEDGQLPEFLERFIAARRRHAPKFERKYYRRDSLRDDPEPLMTELEREARRLLRASEGYLAAREEIENSDASQQLASIERQLQEQREVGQNRRAKLEEVEWIRRQGAAAYAALTNGHGWVFEARDREIEVLQEEYGERRRTIGRRRQGLERSHRLAASSQSFAATNDLCAEFFIDLNPKDEYMFKVSVVPAIRLRADYRTDIISSSPSAR